MTDITQNITAPDRYLLRTTRRIGMLSYKSARVRYEHRTIVQDAASLPGRIKATPIDSPRTFTRVFFSSGDETIQYLANRVVAHSDAEVDTATAKYHLKIGEGGEAIWWNASTGQWQASLVINDSMLHGPLQKDADFIYIGSLFVTTGVVPAGKGPAIEVGLYNADINTSPNVIAATKTIYSNNEIGVTNETVSDENNTAIDYQLTQQSAARGRYDDGSIWFGDGPTAYARSAITRDEAGDEPTGAWRFSDETASIVHANILLREVMDMKRTQVRGLTADLLGEYKPCKVPNIDDFFHFFIGGNQNGKDNKWAANLFRLNRVTDEIQSNGKFITSNYDAQEPINVIFQYRDIDGSLIASQSGTVSATAYYGLEWLAEDKFVYCDGNGRVATLEVNPSTGVVTRTEFGNFAGGAEDLDIDEFGNIYTGHIAGGSGVRKTSLDGSTSIASGGVTRKVITDGQHLYSHNAGTSAVIAKWDIDTLDFLGQTDNFSLGVNDCFLIYPDFLLHLRNPSRIRKIRKTDMEITGELIASENEQLHELRRFVYDENGKVYVLQYRSSTPTQAQVVEIDSDLNILSVNDVLGQSDADEIGIAPAPLNRIYIRALNNVYVYDMSYNLIDTLDIGQNQEFEQRGRFLNVHPGRAAIKFKVLGLTKQF